MKTVKLILSVFAAVSAIACNDIIENAEPSSFPEKEIVLTATREGLSSGTKSFRLDDGSVWWSPSEEVSIFYGSGSNGGSKFVSMNTSIAETVELQGSVQMSGSGKDFWAVYPYSEDNSCDGSSVTTVIPDQQTAVEGNFSNDVFPTIAKSSSLSLAFWNICGGIKFFVSRNDITSVTFKGNNSEPLAGKVKVSFDSDGKPYIAEVIDAKTEVTLNAPDGAFKVGKYYYISLLPASLQNGFTMAFETTDMRGSVVTQKTQAIKRSVFGVLKNVDSTVSDWESTVTVEPEWVDLGLSVKWATFNVGASKPEEYGDYFAWGETEPKDKYSWSNYKWCNGSSSTLTKYNTSSSYGTIDNKTVLDPEDDAAHVNWGGIWRMPTDAEWTELRNSCTWTWTSQNGVNGRMVTGPNGNSIFLPAAGGYRFKDVGSCGAYWSSSLYPDDPYFAYRVHFESSFLYRYRETRTDAFSVRPVYGEFIPVTSIALNKKLLSLYPLASEQLTATFSPSNATKDVYWASSDKSVATVDENGLVFAVGLGSATITVYGSSGASASCNVIVEKNPTIDGFEYVDLGLPSGLKWATMNVGASKYEEYGDYFAWGETHPKSIYSWSTYKYELGTDNYGPFSKYVTQSSYGTVDRKTILDPEDDAAHVNWGGSWRMPTKEEWKELFENCTWTSMCVNGVWGKIVTSKKVGYNDKSIFLPWAGYCYDGNYYSSNGYYWSSSLYFTLQAASAYHSGDYRYVSYHFRYEGHSVRPVTE